MTTKASLAILIALFAAIGAQAQDVTVNIVARVQWVDDDAGTLGGAIAVGDIVTGHYTYSLNTSDSNPDPTVGDYFHNRAPYGITLRAGGFVFQSDPSDTEFLVEIVNDLRSSDRYILLSDYSNLPLSNGALVEEMSWQLDDPTTTALSSDELPTEPPDLADWQSVFGLHLMGCLTPELGTCSISYDRYTVRAEVISAELASADCVSVPLHAKIESALTNEQCESPIGLCTEGVLTKGGVLKGKTFFTAYEIAPSAGIPEFEVPETLSYSGLLEIETHNGILTIRDVGVLDQNQHAFSELDRVVGGTGRFHGASGLLFSFGTTSEDGSRFAGDIVGELCLPK